MNVLLLPIIELFVIVCGAAVAVYFASNPETWRLVRAYKRHRDETAARRRIRWAADLLERSSNAP